MKKLLLTLAIASVVFITGCKKNTYEPKITLLSVPVLGGNTAGAGTFATGSTVTITATPNTGYAFTNWTENGTVVSTNSSYQFTMAANRTLTANFTQQFAIVLSSNPVLGGTLTGAGLFNTGSSVTVTATPNAGYTFTSWSGDATGSANPLTVSMNGNKNITANFTLNTYTLNVTSANGTVVKNPVLVNYNSGSTVTLTATPNAGYTFTSWSGDATGTTNPLTVTMNGNKNITANYTAVVSTYTLNITALNGTFVKNPNQATYSHGTTVQVTATPNLGFSFISWSGDATGNTNPVSVVMNSDKNITANFSAIQYTVTLSSNPLSGGITTGGGTFNSGSSVTVTATPNLGYVFSSWSEGATVFSTTNPLSVTMNANKNITANFITW